MLRQKSADLFKRAQEHIPGGVNSPGRGFKSVGGEPVFIKGGEGPYLIDQDGNRYIDYVGSMGANILGNAHPTVIEAVQYATKKGLGYWLPTELEVELAELLCQLVPNLEMVRLVNSGTEATMSAIRLARAATGRDNIIKFEGCYHGASDSLLVNAGSNALDMGVPSSPGVPKDSAKHTLTADYNDLNSVAKLFEFHQHQIAAVIVEPIAGNMSCVPPQPGFLEGLRELCNLHGALMILDEVMTGFRVAQGGAQEYYNIDADLITIGKIMGGGLPCGAFGGRRDLMERIAPIGPVYHAGTLSGNPISVTAGLATLHETMKPGFYEKLHTNGKALAEGFRDQAKAAEVPLVVNQVGAMFGIFFTDRPAVTSFTHVMNSDKESFKRFFLEMLNGGVFLAPSPYECGFLTIAHDEKIIEQTLKVSKKAFAALKAKSSVSKAEV